LGATQWTLNDISGALNPSTLAASAGSGLIGFVQSGTGAQSRTAQQKLREFVSPFDFGAISDGARTRSPGATPRWPWHRPTTRSSRLTQEIDWAACQAAINAASSFATFSYASPSPPYSSPYWAAATNPLLRFPRGFYELGADQLLWTGDNIVADLRGAVFNYRSTGGAFRWAHLTYGDLLGGQVQLFSGHVRYLRPAPGRRQPLERLARLPHHVFGRV
jgi:hypothetical protein